jgi:hypothetical protein
MAANIDDVITTLKDLVTAYNTLSQTTLAINGVYTTPPLTTATLVKGTSGRVVTLSIIDPGSGDGKVFDINTVAGAAAGNQIAVIESAGALIQTLNLPFLKGLVIEPGTGMTVAVSYS